MGALSVIRHGTDEVQVFRLDPTVPDENATFLIPADSHVAIRLDALSRLIRLLTPTPAPDTRLTKLQRRRIAAMLRASDGRAEDASQKSIAEAMFGRRRVSQEYWPHASLRFHIHRLLTDAARLIDGGYLHLLSPIIKRR
nr:DUF2285 domain-containing protein [Asticcacaulis machinosus]